MLPVLIILVDVTKSLTYKHENQTENIFKLQWFHCTLDTFYTGCKKDCLIQGAHTSHLHLPQLNKITMVKKVKSSQQAMQALRGPGELRLLVSVTTAL